jgi:hypothetical protein
MSGTDGATGPVRLPNAAPGRPPAAGPARLPGGVRTLPPALLAALAEGAWIGVLYALMQASRGEPFVLGPLSLGAFALAGLVAARVLAPRLGGRWPGVALVLVVGTAVMGWLLDDVARADVVAGNLGGAIQRHQAGFLAGLAFLRGLPHAQTATSERALTRILTWITPLLALPLLLGRALEEPTRSAFESQALVDCLLFLLVGTLGLALARVERLGRVGGFAWPDNRAWLLFAIVVALVAVIALPLAFIAGPTVRLIVALALPPLLLAAMVASVSQVTIRAIGIVAAVGLAVYAISQLHFSFAPDQQPANPNQPAPGPNGQDPTATVLTWLPIIVVVVLLLLLVFRRWMRRRSTTPSPAVAEERWTERGVAGPAGRPRLRLPWSPFRRSTAPTRAVEAYLATLDDLARDPDLARRASETPHAHARRLRGADSGGLALDLLAADYQLAAFGGATLSPAEDRRAVRRWRRIRERRDVTGRAP